MTYHTTILVFTDPPEDIMFDVPRNIEVGAVFGCSADAKPPVSVYRWTRVPSGDVLSTRQTLTLTEALAIG